MANEQEDMATKSKQRSSAQSAEPGHSATFTNAIEALFNVPEERLASPRGNEEEALQEIRDDLARLILKFAPHPIHAKDQQEFTRKHWETFDHLVSLRRIPEAMYWTALIYLVGVIGAKDDAKAFAGLGIAAQHGSRDAKEMIEQCLRLGREEAERTALVLLTHSEIECPPTLPGQW